MLRFQKVFIPKLLVLLAVGVDNAGIPDPGMRMSKSTPQAKWESSRGDSRTARGVHIAQSPCHHNESPTWMVSLAGVRAMYSAQVLLTFPSRSSQLTYTLSGQRRMTSMISPPTMIHSSVHHLLLDLSPSCKTIGQT